MKTQPLAQGAALGRKARGEDMKEQGAKEWQGFIFKRTTTKTSKPTPFLFAITSAVERVCISWLNCRSIGGGCRVGELPRGEIWRCCGFKVCFCRWTGWFLLWGRGRGAGSSPRQLHPSHSCPRCGSSSATAPGEPAKSSCVDLTSHLRFCFLDRKRKKQPPNKVILLSRGFT